MKRYRIIPNPNGKFEVEYKYDWENHWCHNLKTKDGLFTYPSYYFPSEQKAREAIEEDKAEDLRAKERSKERLRFQDQNPIIYVD